MHTCPSLRLHTAYGFYLKRGLFNSVFKQIGKLGSVSILMDDQTSPILSTTAQCDALYTYACRYSAAYMHVHVFED